MPSMRMPGLTMRRPAGYPAHRSAASWVFDVLVTLLAVVAAGPSSTHGNLLPHLAAIGLLALSAMPLWSAGSGRSRCSAWCWP